MMKEDVLKEEIREEITRRFNQVVTPQHLLACLLDHRNLIDVENDDENREILLSEEQKEVARNFVFNRNDNFTVVLAAYETKDDTIFPKASFQKSMKHLSPIKYWTYIRQIAAMTTVKEFSSMMIGIYSCPPSSAGIERLFSSMGLIHNKLRNKLTNERVNKLVHVYRYFGWRNRSIDTDIRDLEDELELVLS